MLITLLFPPRCPGCRTWGAPACARCLSAFGPPRRVPGSGPPAFALAPYAGPARDLVLAFKERGRRDLAAVFGGLVAAALPRLPLLHTSVPPAAAPPPRPPTALPTAGRRQRLPPPPLPPPPSPGSPPTPTGIWLVPAPSRPSAARARGGSHVLGMARASGFPVAPALAFAKGVRDSVGLNAASRWANLEGRVRIVPGGLPPPGTPVVLLDDVITTGSTARACISVLKSGGFRVSGVLALTAARRSHSDE